MPRIPKPRAAKLRDRAYRVAYFCEDAADGYEWQYTRGRVQLTPEQRLGKLEQARLKLSELERELDDEIIRYEHVLEEAGLL